MKIELGNAVSQLEKRRGRSYTQNTEDEGFRPHKQGMWEKKTQEKNMQELWVPR